MTHRYPIKSAISVLALVVVSGCAVSRGQETVGSYLDDTAITTKVKGLMFENKEVDGSSISVETLNGTVLLSGFAKSSAERSAAERVARAVGGVKAVRNEIVLKP